MFVLNISIGNHLFAQTIPLVYDVENTGSTCTKPALPTVAQLPSVAKLPNPFAWENGSGLISSFNDWECRRNEIKVEVENYEIGTKPPRPTNITATYSGGIMTVTVVENGQTLTLTSKFTIPTGTGPFPVIIGMSTPTGGLGTNLFNGIIQVPFYHDEVVNYNMNSNQFQSDPYYKLYPSLWGKIGNYSAWSWGVSRIIDGLEILKTQLKIDLKHIGVTGCSYAGKMALFSGAYDERIALTLVQESGGGGVNSWRVSDAIGSSVEKIDNTNYSWFMTSMKNNFTNKTDRLPHDHHELIAMIAPRACLVLGNPDMVWLGDASGYVSCVAAREVWKSMKVEERFGYNFAGGHSHCAASASQNTDVTKFVDKYLRNIASTNTTVLSAPAPISISPTTWITWTTPTLSVVPPNPNAPIISITSPLDNATFEESASIECKVNATDPNSDLAKVEFYNGTLKIGETATSPYIFTWNNVVVGKYSITAIATDLAGNKTTSSAINVTVISTYKINKTTTPIIVDGTVDAIWNNASILSINPNKLLSGTVTNATDLSGSLKALWDNTNLYILADVTDEVLGNDSQNSYDDDAIEVYIDINNDKATAYGANDVQYTFGWNDGTTVGILPAGRSTTGIVYKVVAKTGGYIVEAQIPWTTLLGTPVAGQFVGIDFMVNDDDNAGTRDAKLSWNAATDDAWDDASLFGTAILKDVLPCNSPSEPTVVTPISCYQNSVASVLSATGTALKWYSVPTGGIGNSTAPIPLTSVIGTVSYYVSQTINGCESNRKKVDVTVVSMPIEKVSLTVGWNYIGCPITGSTAIANALASIWANVETIKNQDAFYSNVNVPTLNSLTQVEWGMGYLLKVKAPCVLDWIVK